MDSKLLKLRNNFPFIEVSSQCSNFNLKCERLEYKHSKQINLRSFPTWYRCFEKSCKSLYTYWRQYNWNKTRTEKEQIWSKYTTSIVARINTYNSKDRIVIRVQTIVDKINRDSKKVEKEIFYKPEFRKAFHRQAIKLNKLKGTRSQSENKKPVLKWTDCIRNNRDHLKHIEKTLGKRHHPGWNWFITVKCDYLFGNRNPDWDEAVNTIIGNFKRMYHFQESGGHSGIYR